MCFHIRTLTEDDIEKVQEVVTLSWNKTYEKSIPHVIQMRFLYEAYSKEALIDRMHHSHFFIAEKNKQIVGFANFSSSDQCEQVELGALYLHPNFKRQGIGKALFKTGIKRIGNVKRVLVHVEKHNESAQAFYKKIGFTYVKEFEELFYGHPLQSIQLLLYR